MKIKLSELKPNPFKKQISKGELNREQIDKIKANIKDLGFFGSLPIFKKDNQYFLIAGHHRLQALKEVYGKDWEVKVEVENYNDEQLAKAMIIENLTQRTDDYRELSDNVIFAKNFLKEHKDILEKTRTESGRVKGSYQKDEYKDTVTANDIAEWFDKNTGDVMRKTEINDIIRIRENLHEDLEKEVNKKHNKTREERAEDNLNYSQAVILSGVEKEEQKPLAKVIKESREQRVREQGKLISKYKNAPEEIKERIKRGDIDLADINFEIDKYNLEQARKQKGEIKVKTIKQIIDEQINYIKFSLSDSRDNIKQSLKYLVIISKYIKDMSDNQKDNLDRELEKYEDLFKKLSDLISQIRTKI